jgi:hypothetical protein
LSSSGCIRIASSEGISEELTTTAPPREISSRTVCNRLELRTHSSLREKGVEGSHPVRTWREKEMKEETAERLLR